MKIENCKINYNTTYNVDYDRTSVYLGINNCYFINNILNGSDNARTGVELHGHNIICANNFITNYNSGIYIVNDPTNPTNSDNKFIHVKDNKVFTRHRGIIMWLSFSNMHTERINIHDNDIHILNSNREDTSVGIGTYAILGNNSSIDTILIHHNNIYSEYSNTEMLSFKSTSSSITFNMNDLIITDNHISGLYEYGIRFASNAHNTFLVNNIILNNNSFSLSKDISS